MAAKDTARESRPLGQSDSDPERLRRNTETRREIDSQAQAIDETLRAEHSNIATAARVLGRRSINRAYLIGCGDSLAVMVALRGFLESILGIPCEAMQAFDYAYYYGRDDPNAIVIGLSSTGWTTKVGEGLARARNAGLATVAVSNSEGAPIFSIAEIGLRVHATREGWPTQSSTAAMALIAQLGLDLGRVRGLHSAILEPLQKSLEQTPSLAEETLRASEAPTAELADQELETKLFLYAGGGPSFATALIGAAKVKECTNRHATAIQIEEYHHYLSQMTGEPMFLTVPNGPSVSRSANAMHVGRANGGRIYGLISSNSTLRREDFDWSLDLPAMNELLTPIVYAVPLQLFAYNLGIGIARTT